MISLVSRLRGHVSLESAIAAVPIAGAVVAAVLVLVLRGVLDDNWDWHGFFEDLVRNLFVGGLLTLAILWLERLQRERAARLAAEEAARRQGRQVIRLFEVGQLAATAWSPLNHDSKTPDTSAAASIVAEIGQRVKELRENADALERLLEPDLDDVDAVLGLGSLSYLVRGYLFEGGRARRFIYFELLQRELASFEAFDDSEVVSAVRDFRASLPAAMAWRSHTNTTVIERLLLAKVDALSPGAHDSDELELLAAVRLDDVVATQEPLYLLQAYGATHDSGAIDGAEARRRLEPVRRPIGALRNEMRAVAAALERLGVLIATAANVNQRR